MILPQFLSLLFLCLFPCLCLSKGMWRCGCVVLISSGQGAVMGGREEPERVMERGVVRHTELRPHPLKKKSQKTLQKSFRRKLQKGGKPKTSYSDMKIHTPEAYHQSLKKSHERVSEIPSKGHLATIGVPPPPPQWNQNLISSLGIKSPPPLMARC